jgi:hypothetical protein
MLRRRIHGVPPSLTAEVTVFVTSDAWRILSNGFTVRFAVAAAVSLVTSLLFLIRRNCWLDIDAEHAEAVGLPVGVRRGLPKGFRQFTRCGIKAAPMSGPPGAALAGSI